MDKTTPAKQDPSWLKMPGVLIAPLSLDSFMDNYYIRSSPYQPSSETGAFHEINSDKRMRPKFR